MVRIELPKSAERFGAVIMNDVQRVLELDSGKKREEPVSGPVFVRKIESDEIEDIESRLAIVIPVKRERLKLLEGVLSGIPHDCLVILVSNSPRSPVDRFRMERDAVVHYCSFVQRPAIIIHQKDRVLGEALAEANYKEILDDAGLVRDGKAEGMLIGLLLAKMMEKNFVGFVDADNYVPGAIREYVKNFCAGFCMARTPYSMVRISWIYKPKVSEAGVYFRKWGRIAEYANKFINLMLASHTGFETEIIKTGTSGEHALTMDLAELMPFSSGFSVEAFELLWLLEEFGGIKPTPHTDVMARGAEIFQIETRNPHFHEEKGDKHLQDILLATLGAIYHSSLCDSSIKESIKKELTSINVLKSDEYPPVPTIYPSIRKLDMGALERVLERDTDTLLKIGLT
jgi:mannosyl-3-phosphoglycerate synthase